MTRTARLLIATLTVCAWPHMVSAQQDAPPIRPLIKLVSFANLHIDHCPNVPASFNRTQARAAVATGFERLQSALTERAISHGVERQAAESGVRSYLDGLRKTPANLDRFLRSCPSDYDELLNVLDSDEVEQAIAAYGAATMRHDQRFDVITGDGTTHASPFTQERLLTAMQPADKPCARLQVKEVVLLSRTVGDASKLPIFVKPPITYEERWSVVCNDEHLQFVAKHTRDGDRSLGGYSVAPVRDQ
jgi:hypothetical protein